MAEGDIFDFTHWLKRSSGTGIGTVAGTSVGLRANIDVGSTWYVLDVDPAHVQAAFESSFSDFDFAQEYGVHSWAAGTTINLIITGLSAGAGLVAVEFLKEAGKDLWKAFKSLLPNTANDKSDAEITSDASIRGIGDTISLTLVTDNRKVFTNVSLPFKDRAIAAILKDFCEDAPVNLFLKELERIKRDAPLSEGLKIKHCRRKSVDSIKELAGFLAERFDEVRLMDFPSDHDSRRWSIVPKWASEYERDWLRLDVVAGLTSAAVVIPKAMAYSTIAGLPVEVGLYTAFMPPIVYALLGTSRPLSVSTTTTLAILSATEFGQLVVSDPASLMRTSATLTLLVGATLVLASILQLGFVADFISEPVLVGFKAGIGLVIVFDQVPKILGIHFPRGTFFHNLLSLFHAVPSTSPTTLLLGIVMIALCLGFGRFAPRAPAPLIAVAIGIIGVSLLRLQDHGVELVGQIPQGLPSIVKPDLPLIKVLWPGALGIALMSFTETVAAGRAFTATGEPSPKPNRELLATGLTNAAGALIGCLPAGGGTSQTAVNRLAGARTQLSEIVMAGIALFTMLFLAPLIALMPQATLAAVVIVYSIGLIQPSEFRAILSVRKTEFTWALAAFAGVVILGTLEGIVAAIAVSLLALAYQNADPPVYELRRKPGTNVFRPRSPEHPEDEDFPGLLLVRLEGRVFFANAGHIGQKMNSLFDNAKPRVVAIDLSAVTDLEYTALKMLTAAEERQRKQGVSLWLVGLNPGVLQTVQRSALSHLLGRDALQFNLELAVAKYQTSSVSLVGRHH